MYGTLSVLKSSLFLWEQGIDYWFDTIVVEGSKSEKIFVIEITKIMEVKFDS